MATAPRERPPTSEACSRPPGMTPLSPTANTVQADQKSVPVPMVTVVVAAAAMGVAATASVVARVAVVAAAVEEAVGNGFIYRT